MTQHLLTNLHRKRESYVEDGDSFHVVRSIDVEPMLSGIRAQSEGTYKHRKYIGSIDPVTAEVWARECGHRLYSKEWREYALKKLKDPDYAKFRAHTVKRLF